MPTYFQYYNQALITLTGLRYGNKNPCKPYEAVRVQQGIIAERARNIRTNISMGTSVLEQQAAQPKANWEGAITREGRPGNYLFLLPTHSHIHTLRHSVHPLLVDQLGGIHEICPIEHDDCGCEQAGPAPDGSVCQGVAPGVS